MLKASAENSDPSLYKVSDKDSSKGLETREINDWRIADLENSIRSALEQLKDPINRGEYRIIIGDDASGRIPTLIFDRVLKTIYREHGHAIPETMFIAGSRHLDFTEQERKQTHIHTYIESGRANEKSNSGLATEKISTLFNKFDNKKYGKNNRVLVVTDVVSTGGSLKPLLTVLKQRGVPYDLVTLSLQGDRTELTKKLGPIVVAGDRVPRIYGDRAITGVEKLPQKVISKKFESYIPGTIQEGVNAAREDVSTVAASIIRWYKTLKASARAAKK